MKFTTYLSLAVLLLLLPFCKKEETPATVTPTTTPKPTSVLCDGNGSSDLYPIKLNNKWIYKKKYNGVADPVQANVNIGTGFVLNGKTYFQITDSSKKMYVISSFPRKDSANNTVIYESFYQKDFIEIPAAPKLNETWTYSNSATRKAADLNASIKTDDCSYTGLVLVNEYPSGWGNTTSRPRTRYYFKKGLGIVYTVTYDVTLQGDSTEFMLTKVTLK